MIVITFLVDKCMRQLEHSLCEQVIGYAVFDVLVLLYLELVGRAPPRLMHINYKSRLMSSWNENDAKMYCLDTNKCCENH